MVEKESQQAKPAAANEDQEMTESVEVAAVDVKGPEGKATAAASNDQTENVQANTSASATALPNSPQQQHQQEQEPENQAAEEAEQQVSGPAQD